MSNRDEFEDLIKNFKLDDVEDPAPAQTPPPRRPAFDFEEDNQRYSAARERRPAGAAAVRERPARRVQPPPEYRAPAAQAGGADAVRPQTARKREFKVQIDDEEFYEPSTSSPRPPRGGGGGGRRSGGGDGGDRHSGGGAGRWFKALLVLVVVLGLSVFLAMFALQSASDMFGLNKPEGEVSFELPDEELSISEIASMLQKEGVVTQPLTFRLYATLKKVSPDSFFPGDYTLNTNMSYDEIFVAFRSGTGPEQVTLIFYEGWTLSDIADKLEENGVCAKEDLFRYLEENGAAFEERYPFLADIPAGENRYRRYEGYFFPDTYDFYVGEDLGTVVQKFFNRFDQMVNTDELQQQMKAQNLTLDQAVTLASVIQKEAGRTEDMKMVSSIFHKRLQNPAQFPKLQSDVTIFYVENDIKPYLENPDDPVNQPMYDAYNTYVCDGLPVGPISNPGVDAIKAAIYPQNTDYYYFLADKDGKFYYAATIEEHAANIAAAGIGVDHGITMPGEGGESEPQQ